MVVVYHIIHYYKAELVLNIDFAHSKMIVLQNNQTSIFISHY